MRRIIITFFLIFLLPKCVSSGIVFRQFNQGLRDLDISALSVSRLDPNLAYIGSNRAIYRTENGGRTWAVALSLRGSNKRVNFLVFNQKEPSIIYAATQNGLLRIKSVNSNIWEKLFSGVGELERNCTCVLADGERIFLGTKAGLFISMDSGRNWRKAQGELGRLSIASVDMDEEQIFVSTAGRLFVSLDSGETWRRVFNFALREGQVLEPEDGSEADEVDISYVFIDRPQATSGKAQPTSGKNNFNKLYLATSIGLFVSLDKGASFEQVYSAGLTGSGIRNILSNSGNLYVSTDKGLFVLTKDKQIWQNLYEGLVTSDIGFIAFDSLDRLWLVTDKGVFRSRDSYIYKSQTTYGKPQTTSGNSQTVFSKEAGSDKLNNWQLYFEDEPKISEIQSAAIEYAEVIDPQKIRNLRRGARLKALLPDLDVDYYKTIWGTYSSGGQSYVGPRDWSLGLSWDLGDLVWSEQQRLIDSQVRLMVQLRDDILTEVTRLYFERRRLQVELFTSQPEDPKTKLEKELRLQELTASIDALTGRYLSKQLGIE